jgi:hypothetical protein
MAVEWHCRTEVVRDSFLYANFTDALCVFTWQFVRCAAERWDVEGSHGRRAVLGVAAGGAAGCETSGRKEAGWWAGSRLLGGRKLVGGLEGSCGKLLISVWEAGGWAGKVLERWEAVQAGGGEGGHTTSAMWHHAGYDRVQTDTCMQPSTCTQPAEHEQCTDGMKRCGLHSLRARCCLAVQCSMVGQGRVLVR